MRPIVQTVSAAGAGAPIVLDYHLTPENAAIAVVLSAGASLTYNIEYSLDDPFASYATSYNANATWFVHPILTAQTATAQDVVQIPCRAVRINVTSYASGSATTTVVQSGGIS